MPILQERFRRQLLDEASNYPLRRVNSTVGHGRRRVRQQMHLQNELRADGCFAALAVQFQRLFDRAVEQADLFDSPVVFNDWMLQRYATGCIGITPHRDRTDYRHLICLFVLAGCGRFSVSADRQKTQSIEIANLPGDVILMPGPGFKGLESRPFHCVENITADRWIFGLRHDESKIRSP